MTFHLFTFYKLSRNSVDGLFKEILLVSENSVFPETEAAKDQQKEGIPHGFKRRDVFAVLPSGFGMNLSSSSVQSLRVLPSLLPQKGLEFPKKP